MSPDDGWLMLSTLQHYAYCPRQAGLILDGAWADNALTAQGVVEHQHVDTTGTDSRRGVRAHHRVALASDRLRIHGVADTIEEGPDGVLVPVEHKHGRGAGSLWPSIVQVVGQALCLEDMTGRAAPIALIYITSERRREPVETATHRSAVEALIAEARARLAVGCPVVAYDRARCQSCSIQNLCQPRGVQWQ